MDNHLESFYEEKVKIEVKVPGKKVDIVEKTIYTVKPHIVIYQKNNKKAFIEPEPEEFEIGDIGFCIDIKSEINSLSYLCLVNPLDRTSAEEAI